MRGLQRKALSAVGVVSPGSGLKAKHRYLLSEATLAGNSILLSASLSGSLL